MNMKNRVVVFMDFLEKVVNIWNKIAFVLQKVILVYHYGDMYYLKLLCQFLVILWIVTQLLC